MFKVVADQLKIAQGWVRCGQCSEIFDASGPLQSCALSPLPLQNEPLNADEDAADPAVLQDLERKPEAKLSPEDALRPHATPEPRYMSALEPGDSPAGSTNEDFDPPSWKRALSQQEHQFSALLISESAPDVSGADEQTSRRVLAAVERDEAETSSMKRQEASEEVTAEVTAEVTPEANAEASAEAPADANAAHEVSFVRDAQRRERWNRPWARGLLGVLLLILLGLLAFQWMVQNKDRLATVDARWTPYLQALCRRFECEIRPPRHIESVVIDSSSFTKTGADTYRLSFALKNSGDIALEVPSIELTLTDSQDQAVVSRVLLPRQFGVNGLTMAGQSELTGVVSLKVSEAAGQSAPPSSSPAALSPLNVAGYRILAFYP